MPETYGPLETLGCIGMRLWAEDHHLLERDVDEQSACLVLEAENVSVGDGCPARQHETDLPAAGRMQTEAALVRVAFFDVDFLQLSGLLPLTESPQNS